MTEVFGVQSASGQWFAEDTSAVPVASKPCAWTAADKAQAVADHFRKVHSMLGGIDFSEATVAVMPADTKYRLNWVELPKGALRAEIESRA